METWFRKCNRICQRDKMIFLLILSFSIQIFAGSNTLKQLITRSFPGYEIVQKKDVEKNLREYLESNKIDHPGYVCGNFVTKNITTCSVLLMDSKKSLKKWITFTDITKPSVFIDHPLELSNKYKHDFYYLDHAKKKTFRNHDTGKNFKLSNECFEFNSFEKYTYLNCWDGTAFKRIITSD